jgi:nucleoid DNA-binding protein
MAEKTTEALKAMNKSDVYKKLAEKAGLDHKQVQAVFKALDDLVKEELSKKGGAREFVIPNIVKLKLLDKPATKATKKPNPFKKGEMMDVKAKPASVVVKARILKGLKEIKPATKATKAAKPAKK